MDVLDPPGIATTGIHDRIMHHVLSSPPSAVLRFRQQHTRNKRAPRCDLIHLFFFVVVV